MSNQLQITGGAKVRNLNGVITGTTGVLGSVPLGAANGVATLDSSGKVPVSQLPASVVTYLGTWNAATNTPTLTNGTGDPGDLYICNVAGTANFGAGPITFAVGDWVLYGSGTWQKSSGQNGTVTSVAVTETGDALTITGSPITTAGTINIGFAGTSAQYVAGDGSLVTFPSLTVYVPYTGATGNVNLGEYELKAGQLSLDVSPTGTASVGTTKWNNTIGLSETTLKGGSVVLKNGVDLVARVVNKVTPNTTLTKAAYQAVRVSGAQGQRLAVAFAQANNDNNSADTLGIVIETIPTNQEGFIMTVGQLEGVNTTGSLQGETWADGDVLYLSPTTPGALTNVKPTGLTGHIVVMGYVEYAHSSNGSIYVKIMNGWELDELHNVYISSPTNNQGLFYNSSNSLWENKSIATALGYTPADDSLVVKLAGTQNITGEKTFSSTYGITLDGNGTNSGSINFKLYNGASARGFGYSTIYSTNGNIFAFYYPIDSSNNSKQFKFNLSSLTTNTIRTYTMPDASGTLALTSDIPSLSATAPISYSGGVISISQATTSTNGYLSSTDWNTFNNKIATSGTIPNGTLVKLSSGALVASDIVNSTSGLVAVTGTVFVTGNYVKSGGTSTQFLKADGSVDSNTYLTTSSASSTYLPLAGGTLTGALTVGGRVLASGGSTNAFSGNNNSGSEATIYLTNANAAGWAVYSAQGINYFGGNVGIGTTSPTYALDILTSGAQAARFAVSGTNLYTAFRANSVDVGYIGNGVGTVVGGSATDFGLNAANNMVFSTTGATERMRITSTGNVGIGTSSPSELLDVRNSYREPTSGEFTQLLSSTTTQDAGRGGSLGFGGFYSGTSSYTTFAGIKGFKENGDGGNTAGALSFLTRANGGAMSERMRITSGGVLLVGTTSTSIFGSGGADSGTMISGGNMNLKGASTSLVYLMGFFNPNGVVGSITVSGSSTAYNTSSDYRLKQDLKEFNGLNLISSIKTYDYEWKSDNTRAYGVIAHELAEVLPQAVVGKKDGEQMQGVDYSKLVPVLIKAIQELETRLKTLENK